MTSHTDQRNGCARTSDAYTRKPTPLVFCARLGLRGGLFVLFVRLRPIALEATTYRVL